MYMLKGKPSSHSRTMDNFQNRNQYCEETGSGTNQ